MSSLNKTSIFVENQLPGFIRGNPEYTLFVQFLQKYYEFLELPGNPVYELRRAQENYDIDLARKTLLRYFKDKILPSFPEETELSTEKIIKAARDFYAKKGTADSFKFLFRVLYNQDVDIFLPKTNILRASDGKWQIPQAIRISFADRSIRLSGNVTVNTATSNVVDYIGNLAATGLSANSYIRVGKERRKVLELNTISNKINVEVAFANTADAIANGVIYRSGNSIYRLFPNDNSSFNYNLLKNKVAVGVNSRTTCIIENAFRTYDFDSGQEIAELYVSNVNREFEVGEDLQIEYLDSDGATRIFTTKIISLISNVVLLKDRFNNTLGGNEYIKGDPVVFYDGLDSDIDQAKKAVAVVDDVTTGGIDVVKLEKRGYYFRTSSNGGLIQIQSTTGVGANLLISDIFTDGGANSSIFSYATDAIIYKKDILLNDDDYEFDNVTNIIGLTVNPGNSNISVNLSTTTYTPSRVNDYYKSFLLTVTSGTGAGESAQIVFYNGNTKIAFLDPPLTVSLDATSNVKITANAQTEIGRAMTYDSFVLGKIRSLDLVNPGTSFAEPPKFEALSTFETDYSLDSGFQYISGSDFYGYDPDSFPSPSIKLNSSNNQFSLADDFYNGVRLFVDTGDTAHYATVTDYVVTNPATAANVKILFLDRKFESNINPLNINRFNLFFDYRADVRNIGRIGGVDVISGGSGYSSADTIIFLGTGYSARGSPITTPTGRIVGVSVTNHGEGYYGPVTAIVRDSTGANPSSGSGASFFVWTLSDGELITSTTTDVGKIRTFKILNRGFGYANTPNVSLKVVDIFSTSSGNLENKIISGSSVWQGNVNIAASDINFTAKVDDVYDIPGTSNTIIRLYDYNGELSASPIYVNVATGNITFSNTVHIGSYSFKNIYNATERLYPYFYGNGLAKARAEFLNGLIKYQGYYLNTDGFPSSDQRLQNKDYYHNYSYEIQSEKSIDDYRSTVYDVIHPAGTQLLSKYLIKDIVNVQRDTTSNITTTDKNGGTISTSSFTNVLSGSGAAALAANANVGDIIIINSTTDSANVERQFIRQITSVSPSLLIDGPVIRYSDGELRMQFQSNVAEVVGNTFPVLDTLRSNDEIYLYLSNPAGIYPETISSISGKYLTLNVQFPYANQNVSYGRVVTLTDVPYRLIKQIG